MSYVQHQEDGDAVQLSWGEGETFTFRPGDDTAMWAGYRKAVACALANGAADELDDIERSVAREIQDGVGIRKDAADAIIIAWFPFERYPELATKLSALCGGNVRPEDVHLTLLYLGDPDEDGSGPWDPQMIAAVTKLFTAHRCSLDGTVSGLGRFVGPENEDVVVALVDIPGLGHVRNYLKDELGCQSAVPYNSALYSETHGYVPHITVGYIPKTQTSPAPLDEAWELEIDQLTLCVGETRVSFNMDYDGAMEAENATPYFAAREALEKAYCPLHGSFECEHAFPWQEATFDPRKAGRTISGKNMDALRAAHEAIARVMQAEMEREGSGMSGDGATAPTEAQKRREFLDAVAGGSVDELAIQYVVTKAVDEQRYSLGPLYAPERKDAHGEWTTADELQKSVWDYVRESSGNGRRLNLQHGDLGNIQVAEWVEIMAWPYEHTITVKTATGEEHDLEMPAGTVYVGAVWDEDAWPLVKAGKLNGWSLGGKAVRVVTPGTELPSMGYKL